MAKQLHLGLDLKGGVHLVLRVQTDDALRTHTSTATEQLRESRTNDFGVHAGSVPTCLESPTFKRMQTLLPPTTPFVSEPPGD